MAATAPLTLLRVQPRLKPWLRRLPPLRPIVVESFDLVDALVRSICHQQLSGKAAQTIVGRLEQCVGATILHPEPFASVGDEALRGCGLSRAKVAAIRDLCARAPNLPRFSDLLALSNADLIAQISAVRGIGPWTVQMMLIFRLGRPDVWPADDLGVRHGLRLLHCLDAIPTAKWASTLAPSLGNHASLMARYCWQIADLNKSP